MRQYFSQVEYVSILTEVFVLCKQAATLAGWIPGNDMEYPKVKHVGFGLVLGEDGKRFRTRASEVVRLVDLLDEAKNRSKNGLIERGMSSYTVCAFSLLWLKTRTNSGDGVQAKVEQCKILNAVSVCLHFVCGRTGRRVDSR